MPIEVEAPEALGYERIRHNLAESSVSDVRLRDLAVALDDLVLQYGDHLGHAGLRELIAADGPGLRPDDVMLTPGAAGALFIVSTCLLAPGDHLVVIRPNYATNLETPRAIGAEVSILDLTYEQGWRVDPDALAALLRPETRLVSITTPHNPTGQVTSQADLARIVAMAEAHPRAMVLVDETYRELTFGDPPPLAAARSSRVISVSSLSKAYGLPGIRLGWLLTTDRGLREQALAAKEQMVITGSTVDEAIGYVAMRRRDELLTPIRERSRVALDVTRAWMAGQDVFEWVEPRGGVVGFPRVRAEIELDTDRFYAELFERHATIVGPGHWFEQPDRSFRLGFGWPTHEELAGGLAAIGDTAARLARPGRSGER
jgi:aspartate/methionine/tyrosine aminotransferase